MSNDTLIAIMAIVTAFVSYLKAFSIIPTKYLPIVALILAAVFLTVPTYVFNIITVASMIGLGATGFYHTAQNNTPVSTTTTTTTTRRNDDDTPQQ